MRSKSKQVIALSLSPSHVSEMYKCGAHFCDQVLSCQWLEPGQWLTPNVMDSRAHLFHNLLLTFRFLPYFCNGSCNPLFTQYQNILLGNSFGHRCFAVAGPSTWNSLPDSLHNPALSLSMFRRQLKTYFFSKYWRYVLSALEIFW